MSNPITPKNSAALENWCRSHDWGRQARIATLEGRVFVCYLIELTRDAGGVLRSELCRFDDIDDLRAWAGY